MKRTQMVVYLVWTRDPRTGGAHVSYDDPITYRDWSLVVRDIKAALDHGRQIRIARATLARTTWHAYPTPSVDQVRRLRGQAS